MRRYYFFLFFITLFQLPLGFAIEIPLSIFPLTNYAQDVDAWINPSDPHYKDPLIPYSYQVERSQEFYKRYFSTHKESLSPWNKHHVNKILDQKIIQTLSQEKLDRLNKTNDPKELGFGENFRPYEPQWFEKIATNMDLSQFKTVIQFTPEKRGILVENVSLRSLPTHEVYFYNFELPGEGYPFDNLQVSSLWAGTPLYIFGETKDKSWSFVMTPDLTGWVPTEAIAKVNHNFITRWQNFTKQKLAAITETQTPIIDAHNKKFYFKSYVGAVFPVIEVNKLNLKILVPVKDLEGNARIRYAWVSQEKATLMPLSATRQNFAKLIKTLQNRPYGWGGAYFYNDCSAELKSLYTPFGIWMPRNSSQQFKVGKKVDKSSENLEQRLKYLSEEGKPFMTFVYVGGHIVLYLGNYPDPNHSQSSIIMTYQNVWGLRPLDQSRRAVIGKALLFPLLKSYPEDPELNTQANQKIFEVIYLDQWPDTENN